MKTSLHWDGEAIVAVDQRVLPREYRLLRITSVAELIGAIQSLAIRGAPAIGLAGALGVALSAHLHRAAGETGAAAVEADAARLAQARPTAVNLAWGVRRALGRLAEGPEAVLAEATAMLAEDAAVNGAAARRAADLVRSLTPDRPLRLLTHCNTGRLATAAVGTALGTILELAERGCVAEVLVDETRPLLQGARLTAWELGEAAVPYRICVDSAAAAAMAQGLVDCVLVGADRIADNGDTANKIGTYTLAVAAAHHGIPFLVVAPESTWDRTLPDGSGIVIEERDPAEVTHYAGTAAAPVDAGVYNPAFDVTPARLITAIVSERRTVSGGRAAERGTSADTVVDASPSDRIAALLTSFPDCPEPGSSSATSPGCMPSRGCWPSSPVTSRGTSAPASTGSSRWSPVGSCSARRWPSSRASRSRWPVSRGSCPARCMRPPTTWSTAPTGWSCRRGRSRPASGCCASMTCWPPGAPCPPRLPWWRPAVRKSRGWPWSWRWPGSAVASGSPDTRCSRSTK